MSALLRAFLVDDEPLAVRRLERLLAETGRVSVAGSATDPVEALARLPETAPDVLFLDIEMPGLDGFAFLSQVPEPPLVVFTTAYHQYALPAFEANAIDYLLKPVERAPLERALMKLERLRDGARPAVDDLLRQVAALVRPAIAAYPERLPSRVGDRIEFVDVARVTHFYAHDKLTYAATPERHYCIDQTVSDLEEKLDPRQFVRIHRATLVRIACVHELHGWFAGRLVVRLNDAKRTELAVARDRVKSLKDRLGM